MLTGEYRNTIDDKGRILIPSRLRASLEGDTLIITRGVEQCLWIMLPDYFDVLRRRIMDGPGAMFDKRLRLLQRRIIAPAQECEIDKSGRINIPPTLRDSAGLVLKEESVMLGVYDYLEIWNPAAYEQYMAESDGDFDEASQALSEDLKLEGRR
ncbi:MAG: division/cell wall cluster transcriptional repressor MraZ [Sphaerochaetaceae bacterium]|nr:division/cell wall cluster transcriptional repressor MraZ [Sphaerochaetaceae bacterium]